MVGNLPFQADERALGDALGHLGNITDCKVRPDPIACATTRILLFTAHLVRTLIRSIAPSPPSLSVPPSPPGHHRQGDRAVPGLRLRHLRRRQRGGAGRADHARRGHHGTRVPHRLQRRSQRRGRGRGRGTRSSRPARRLRRRRRRRRRRRIRSRRRIRQGRRRRPLRRQEGRRPRIPRQRSPAAVGRPTTAPARRRRLRLRRARHRGRRGRTRPVQRLSPRCLQVGRPVPVLPRRRGAVARAAAI